jgi:hypothetical protein
VAFAALAFMTVTACERERRPEPRTEVGAPPAPMEAPPVPPPPPKPTPLAKEEMHVVVNVDARKLHVWRHGKRVATHGVAVGTTQWPTRRGEWQLVLLKPPGCNPCGFAEEVLRRRGFVQRAELTADGNRTITARVVRRPTADLTPQEIAEVAALPYIVPGVWELQAGFGRVLLERDGHVMSAGTLPDSADPRLALLPSKVLLPAEADDPAPPCGSCRQTMSEFAPDLKVTSYAKNGKQATWRLGDLLPEAFALNHLRGRM